MKLKGFVCGIVSTVIYHKVFIVYDVKNNPKDKTLKFYSSTFIIKKL